MYTYRDKTHLSWQNENALMISGKTFSTLTMYRGRERETISECKHPPQSCFINMYHIVKLTCTSGCSLWVIIQFKRQWMLLKHCCCCTSHRETAIKQRIYLPQLQNFLLHFYAHIFIAASYYMFLFDDESRLHLSRGCLPLCSKYSLHSFFMHEYFIIFYLRALFLSFTLELVKNFNCHSK